MWAMYNVLLSYSIYSDTDDVLKTKTFGRSSFFITLQFYFVSLVENFSFYIFDIHGEVNFFLREDNEEHPL